MKCTELNLRQSYFLYAGSWDHITGKPGIGLFRFCPESEELKSEQMLDVSVSCGSMCLDTEKNVLYAANEVTDLPGRHGGGGRIAAYLINRKDGHLKRLDEVETLCPNPSYISLDETGNYMVVSNHSAFGAVTTVKQDEGGNYYADVIYDDATVNLYERKEDGSIGKLLDVVKHKGAGIKPKQFHPHPHSAVRSPLWNLFAVCDKGNDGIYLYKLDYEKQKLVLCQGTPYQDIPGSSPRYGVFHPKRPYFFCNHEDEPVVHSFAYTEDGKLTRIDTVSVVPERVKGKQMQCCEQQDFKISSDGRYLYVLVHGTGFDGVVVLETDESGKIKRKQILEVKGSWPRGCTFSPDGKYMFIGCMMDGRIEVYKVEESGMLSAVTECCFMPGLSCLTMIPEGTGYE